ncbi:YncE family protein [Nocardia nova]|uniref:YncE family protein n=1 Tax=Nocardia nova TaxID=37330 RepID=UPI0037A59E7F
MRGYRSALGAVLAAAGAVVLVAGCSSHSDDTTAPAAGAPGRAAAAPAATATPAGAVTAFGPVGALLAEPATGRVVALDPNGLGLRLVDPVNPSAARAITLPAHATGLALGAPGEVLVAAGREVLRVDIATAAIRPVPVDGDVRAIARRGDGSLVAGLDGGRVQILDADGHPNKTVSGLGTVDAVAATANAVATLNLDQTTLTELDLDRDRPGLALRAGLGATHVISDHYGRLLATDTSGGALLVYTTDPLLLRQRFPVGPSPYALAYDERSDTVWLTLSGSNEVVGFDLSTGIPEEVGRFATVRQPNSLTIDSRTGDMFVGSATGDGLQRIGADQRKRGQ